MRSVATIRTSVRGCQSEVRRCREYGDRNPGSQTASSTMGGRAKSPFVYEVPISSGPVS